MAAGNPTDGIRRYEELVAEAKKIAETALAIAMTGSVLGTSGVLDIPHGGTGANRKVFVDTYSNQFNIHGSKTFHDSCAFQKESDIVDSQELSGNVRLVTCDPQGADIGPQLRFSGRNTDNDLTVFAFATIAGRKFNSISGDRAGYLQFATTDTAGVIAEAARFNHQRNLGIGVIPTVDSCNRLSISGGNVFIDYGSDGVGCVGNEVSLFGREYRIQVGVGSHPDVMARVQAIENWFTAASAKHLFLGINTRLKNNGICAVDDLDISTAGIEIMVDAVGGQINFYTTPPGNSTALCTCPSLRGFFHDGGLDILGDIIATPSSQPCGVLQGNIIAGGARNYPDAALDSGGHRGNCDAGQPGMVSGDNLHWGTGSPEGVICAPVGAIYGRKDPSTDNEIAYLKGGDHYGPTMWLPIPLSQQGVCIDNGCPDPDKCPYWLDPTTGMLWYWDPNAKPGQTVPGAWLSVQTFNINRAFPLGEAGTGHSQVFRGKLNKDYEYLAPLHMGRNKRHPSGRFDIYFTDASIVWRTRNNGLDPVKNYYILDLVTLKRRQGEPKVGTPAYQEWPGDRAEDDGDDTTNYDSTASNNIKGYGHTFHPNLPTPLVARALTTSDLVVKWVGTVNGLSTSNVNRRVCFDPTALVCQQVDGSPTPCVPYIADLWRPNLNRATGELPINDGFTMRFTGGTTVNIGEDRFIDDSGFDTTFGGFVTVRKNWNTIPQIGDTFEITSSQYKRVLARLTTRGNVYWPKGPYGNNRTKDIQDFCIGTYATTFQSNDPGGLAPGQTDPYDPAFAQYMQIAMDYYLPLVTDGIYQTGLDAVMLALLWDSVVEPGKIAGCFNVGYRLAMPSNSGNPC
jgi:hypothetical protein